MATTKRIIQAPTLNNSGQITGGSSAPGGYLRKLPNELPGGDGPNSVRVIQTPQTNDSGNITGGNGVRTGTNTAEDPSTYNFTSITGVKQNTGNRVVVDGKEYILDGGARNATQNNTGSMPSTVSKDNSAVLATAGKTGITNTLPQGKTDSLPGVTKYAGQDQTAGGIKYGNNRAGIDLVNRQSELNNLSEAEKAQRLAGAYNPVPLPTNLPKGFTAPDSVEAGPGLEVIGYRDNPDGTTTNYLSDGTFDTVKYNKDGSVQTSNGTPAPTVATTQNPVVKKTLPKEETPVKPDIQAMDLPTIQENIDRLTYKVNSGKSLTEDEYVTFNQLRRQATEMMKPQSLKGGLDDLKNIQQSEITTTQQTLEEQNKADLEAFTKSQEAYKASQIAMIEREEGLSRQRMAAIFGATGQDSSTDTISTFGQMEQNYSLQKQAKIEEVQAKIDLFGSQQRKDSAETIQKMKDRLYSTQLKAAEFDVANLQEINKYNQEQSKSALEKLDNLKAMSDSILASSTPLTEEQKKQAAVIGQFLVDPDGGLNQALLESYKKTNPNLIPYALSMAVGERNKIQDTEKEIKLQDQQIKMMGINADMMYKQAQIEKLRNDMTQGNRTEGEGGVLYDKNTGIRKQDVDISGSTGGGVQITSAIQRAIQSCSNGAQCGKFVNDVLQNAGKGRLIGDSYQSKVNAVNSIGEARNSNEIGTGSIFTYPVKGSNYGHIGIITGVNNDGTINLLDYNYQGTERQRERLNVSPSEILNMNGKISKPIIDSNTVPAPVNNKPLTDKQFTQSNQVISQFKGDAQVKSFEEAYANGLSLLSSLNDASGPGDIGAVFQFMKTLDPQSVVKEGEFALAAKSAGVREQFKNIPANKLEGTILTAEQRKAFGKLAKQYIKDKSTIYQTKYEDGIRRLDKQGIDTSVFPTNVAKGMMESLGETETQIQNTTGGGRRQG